MDNQVLESLRKQGIDVDAGMRYADQSLEFYQELIAIFLEEYEEKCGKVKEKAGKAQREYTVLVHGLKNSAGYLGANDLAGLAYEQEKASKEGNTSYINDNLETLLTEWEKTARIFHSALS